MRKHTHIDAGMIYVDRERERGGERQTRSMDKEWKLYCRDRHNTTCLYSQRWRHHTSIYRTLDVLYTDVYCSVFVAFCCGHCFFFDVLQGIMCLTIYVCYPPSTGRGKQRWTPLWSWGARILSSCTRAGGHHDWCHRISRRVAFSLLILPVFITPCLSCWLCYVFTFCVLDCFSGVLEID